MLIRFLKHSTGSGRHAINYLLGEKDHKGEKRAGVRVVRGDAYLIGDLIDSMDTIHRYTSGVIAFHPDDQPKESDIEALLTDFETVCFAGLEGDQYSWCAVEHLEDDGSKHIHIVVPRVELTTGKAMNVAPPGHEYFFDKWRDSWNSKKGWRSPKDPEIARGLNQDEKPLPDWRSSNAKKSEIQSQIGDILNSGRIKNRAELIDFLNGQGEVTRAGTDYISFKPINADKAMRLKGALFAEDWVYAPSADKSELQPDLASAKRYRDKLKPLLDKRASYNKKRYEKPRAQIVEFDELKDLENADSADSYPTDVIEAIERAEVTNRSAIKINRAVESRLSEPGIEQRIDDAKRAIENTQRTIEFAKQTVDGNGRAVEKIRQGLSIFAESITIFSKLISRFAKGVSKMLSPTIHKDMDIIIRANAERNKKKKDEEDKRQQKDSDELLESIIDSMQVKVDDDYRESITKLQHEALFKISQMTEDDMQNRVIESLMEHKSMSFADASAWADNMLTSGVPELVSEYSSTLMNGVMDDIDLERRQNAADKPQEPKRGNDYDYPAPSM